MSSGSQFGSFQFSNILGNVVKQMDTVVLETEEIVHLFSCGLIRVWCSNKDKPFKSELT